MGRRNLWLPPPQCIERRPKVCPGACPATLDGRDVLREPSVDRVEQLEPVLSQPSLFRMCHLTRVNPVEGIVDVQEADIVAPGNPHPHFPVVEQQGRAEGGSDQVIGGSPSENRRHHDDVLVVEHANERVSRLDPFVERHAPAKHQSTDRVDEVAVREHQPARSIRLEEGHPSSEKFRCPPIVVVKQGDERSFTRVNRSRRILRRADLGTRRDVPHAGIGQVGLDDGSDLVVPGPFSETVIRHRRNVCARTDSMVSRRYCGRPQVGTPTSTTGRESRRPEPLPPSAIAHYHAQT